MAHFETCENCKRLIGEREQAMVLNDQILCPDCYEYWKAREPQPRPQPIQKVEAAPVSPPRTFEYEDCGKPWPPQPTPPLFSVTKVEFHPIQRVKIVIHDPDANKMESQAGDLPGQATPDVIAAHFERETGNRVVKIVVLDRFWVARSELSTAEKIACGIGLFSLFS